MASKVNCSTRSACNGAKGMTSQVFLVLSVVLLLGAAWFAAQRAERRRDSRRRRLQAIVASGPSEGEPGPSLWRTIPHPIMRVFVISALSVRIEAALAATGNRIGVPHLFAAGLVAAAATVVFGEVVMGFGWALAVALGGAAGLAVAAALLHLVQSWYRKKFLDAFPDALDLICRAVRAGLPIFDAMDIAGREVRPPVGNEFQRMLEETRIGVEIDEALQHTADRIRVPDFRFFVVALKLQRRTGGSLADTLANLSRVIRRRKEIRLKARALSSEAKTSAVVLGLLPFVLGGLMYFLNQDMMQILLVDPRGRFMMGVAFLSVVTGIIVMAVMIKKSLR
jgi:tight adherence protein B